MSSTLEKLYEIQKRTSPSFYLVDADSEPRFIINSDERKIEVPDEFKILGVKTDHQSETIYFEIDRIFDDVDLSTKTCVIQYINAGKDVADEGIYPVSSFDIDSSPGKILFKWEIDNVVCRYAGLVAFSVRFYEINSELRVYDYCWNTIPTKLPVLDGLDIEGTVKEYYPTELMEWNERMQELKNQISDMIDQSEQDFTESLGESRKYAEQAKNSATSASASASAAKTSETNAKVSETAAKTSADNASASATAAANSAAEAKKSQDAAKASETTVANSAATAAQKATEATTAASEAKKSEANAASSASDAAASKSAAKTSETNAEASKTAAASSASAAKTSETNAASSKTAAANSASAAKTSETNAAASAENALNSEKSAKASQDAAKTSETNAGTSASTANSKATAAANSATAAKTSETNAAASASTASSKASDAASSAAAAAGSASTASTKASEAASSASVASSKATAASTSASEAEKQAGLAKDYADQAASIAQGQKGFFNTPTDLKSSFPTGKAGDWAIVGSTDSMWVWDVETKAWVDTHKGTDLSNYYNKTQSDERFATKAQGTKADSALQPTGNASNTTVAFTASSSRANIVTGEKLSAMFGKIAKWFTDLKTVAWSGAYSDLTGVPTSLKNPNALTISLNGTSQGAYDGSAAKSVNITPSSIGAAASSHSHTKSQITDFPASLKNPTNIKIQLNGGTTEGTNQFTYDGSAAKNINITPAGIGAATTVQGGKADTALQPNGNASNVTVAFTAASARANITTGEKLATIMGKLAKWFTDLKTVAWSGSYNDLNNKPTALKNPQALTISLNGASQGAYDGSTAKSINVTPAGIGAATATQGGKADTAVQSVNGKKGTALTLSAEDVGAVPTWHRKVLTDGISWKSGSILTPDGWGSYSIIRISTNFGHAFIPSLRANESSGNILVSNASPGNYINIAVFSITRNSTGGSLSFDATPYALRLAPSGVTALSTELSIYRIEGFA